MNRAVALVVAVLATWRLASLFVQETGPFAVFARLRSRAGADIPGELTGWAELFTCIWCFSIYTAVVVYMLLRILPQMVYILALSAGAILVDSYARKD